MSGHILHESVTEILDKFVIYNSDHDLNKQLLDEIKELFTDNAVNKKEFLEFFLINYGFTWFQS